MDLGIHITPETYKKLLADSRFLARLEAAGVDNWEGYGEAFSMGDDE